jgi:hypothetical protein
MVLHNTCTVEVQSCSFQAVDIVSELTESAVAVEAEDAPHLVRCMIVIDMLGIRPTAHCTDATLFRYQRVDVRRADPVSTQEVVVATASVEPSATLLPTCVVARLAIHGTAVSGTLVPGELLRGLPGSAVRAALHAGERTKVVRQASFEH